MDEVIYKSESIYIIIFYTFWMKKSEFKKYIC